MSEPPKSSVDPTKITGPYPLLASLLIVVEGLLGFWFFKAEGPIERSVAGILMTAILLAVIIAVIRIVERSKLRVRGLDTTITVARKEATPEQISSPEREAMAGPDGSYLINRPPPDWTVEDLSLTEWAQRNIGIVVKEKNKTPNADPELENVVRVFRSPRVLGVLPIPGRTKLDGVRYPTALEVQMPTMLTVFRINRAQPPVYAERSLSHNFFTGVNAITASGLLTLRTLSSGTIAGSGRKYQKAEFSQRLEDVIVAGREGQSVDLNITVIGIESDLWDHMLMMHYPSGLSSVPGLDADLEALLALVNSFQPLKIINPELKRSELKREAEKKSKEFIEEKGEDLFHAEIGIAFLRIRGLNLNDPQQRLRAIQLLKPFEVFAKEIDLDSEDTDQLFLALHEAETGDATEFIKQVRQATAAGDEKGEETVQPPLTLPLAQVNPPGSPQ